MAGVELDRCANGHDVSNQQSEKKTFPNTKLDSPWGKLVATYNFAASPLLHRMISTPVGCPKVVILTRLPFAAEMWAQMGQNNKHSLEEHLWHVASTTSTVASLPVARLELLPSQAKLPRHDGWRRTWQMCQWPWSVKSTIRKEELPQHKSGSPWENWSLPTTSQLHLFALHDLYSGPI